MAGVSDEMRALFEGQKRLHEAALRLQRQIEEEEAAYLEETVHGNIVRGWDGFIDSKPNRKEANTKKLKPYTEAEHLFSGCCSYAELGGEPTFDLVDYNSTHEESAGRRRLTVTLSGGAKISSEVPAGSIRHGSSSSSHGHGASGSSGSKLSSMKAGLARGHYAGKEASAAAGSLKTGKLLKKRKRDAQQQSQASSRAHNDATAEEDDATASAASTPMRSRAGSTADSTGGEDSADAF